MKLKIGVVGPCACGKTTLIKGLEKHGYQARHIVQEHSYVPNMWQIVSQPDLLIFLDVSYEVSMQRRKMNWTLQEYGEEQNRLRHARRHANLYVKTDGLLPEEVLDKVLKYVKSKDPIS